MAKARNQVNAEYVARKKQLLQLVVDLAVAGTTHPPESAAAVRAIHASMRRWGYEGTFSASQFTAGRAAGKRPVVPHIVAALACFVASHGKHDEQRKWATTPDECLEQIYNWLDFGQLDTPDDAPPAILAERKRSVAESLQRLNPAVAVALTEADEETLAAIERGTMALALEAMEVAWRRVRGHVESTAALPDEPEPEPLPCDQECPLVFALHVKRVVTAVPPEDGDADRIAEATGIDLERVDRLLCGDLPSDGEIELLTDTYGLPADYLPGMLAMISAARLNANNDTKARGTVGNHKP